MGQDIPENKTTSCLRQLASPTLENIKKLVGQE